MRTTFPAFKYLSFVGLRVLTLCILVGKFLYLYKEICILHANYSVFEEQTNKYTHSGIYGQRNLRRKPSHVQCKYTAVHEHMVS
jgi:hypothetical protein